MDCGVGVFVVFFFKQKTAYEMRISDWSSDVCSSDLLNHGADQIVHGAAGFRENRFSGLHDDRLHEFQFLAGSDEGNHHFRNRRYPGFDGDIDRRLENGARLHFVDFRISDPQSASAMSKHGIKLMQRSEDHTSELQSLMRISYAVFCLKKKTDHKP